MITTLISSRPPGNDLHLLGDLNSATAFCSLQQITTKMKNNAMAMQTSPVSQLPAATPAAQAAIAALVQQILAADAAAREAAADAALYGVALPGAAVGVEAPLAG